VTLLGRTWSPPPGWPTPPRGWTPPAGWVPDPSWPPAPRNHRWWPLSRGSRWLFGSAIVVGVLCFGLVTSCTVLAVTTGPCVFDPPPGDVGSLPISNDTAQVVTLLDCADDACKTGDNAERLAAGASTGWQYEMCGGSAVGVRNASGVLLGCLVMPIGEPPTIKKLAVSQARPCSATSSAGMDELDSGQGQAGL
jgi:hypothetical protein